MYHLDAKSLGVIPVFLDGTTAPPKLAKFSEYVSDEVELVNLPDSDILDSVWIHTNKYNN